MSTKPKNLKGYWYIWQWGSFIGMLYYSFYLKNPITAVKEIRFWACTIAFIIATAAVDIIRAINERFE